MTCIYQSPRPLEKQAVLLLGTLSFLLMFVASLSTQRNVRELQATFSASAEAPTWVASTLSLEHSRFIDSLKHYVEGTNSVTRDTLRERLDIYWSRYVLLSAGYKKFDGSDSHLADKLPPDLHSESLERLNARIDARGIPTLKIIEQMLEELQPYERQGYFDVRERLDPIGSDLAEFQIVAHEYTRYLSQVRVALSGMVKSHFIQSYSFLGIGFALLISAGLLNYRRKIRTAVELRSINRQLVAEVDASTRLATELERRASLDDLSGLLNRYGFKQQLDSLFHSKEGSHGLCIVDLDMFKVVNDSCGHAAGDLLIENISTLLSDTVGNSGLVARLGGDEFAILMRDVTRKSFDVTIAECCQSLRAYSFIFDESHFDVTGSFGAVYFASSDYNSESAVAVADAACYQAKRAGGARVHFHSDASKYVAERRSDLHWVHEIGRAFNEDRFSLHYQPIVALDTRDGQPQQSWEILLRMQDGLGEYIPPAHFLEVAERYSLAPKIDRWVIEQVFAWCNRNCDQITRVKCINVNLSGRSVGDPDLLDFIERETSKLRVDTACICFEITETAAAGEHARQALGRLKELGFQLALDDFGTGFSSFGYLETLPVDVIKIDGLFVRDIDTNDTHHEFVKAINTVGKAMGKKTVAEYVSNRASVDILRKLGVDGAQGYFIAAPTPLPHWLSNVHDINRSRQAINHVSEVDIRRCS